MFLACFRDLEAVSVFYFYINIIFFFFEAKYVFGPKIIKKKTKYAKLLSKIISDAKYILLFHISSWYFRFVFLNRCQLKEIDSTCIIFEKKSK